jgi:hypothetical protein
MKAIANALNNIAIAISNLSRALAPVKEQPNKFPVSNTVTSNPGTSNVKITSIYEGKNYYEKGSQTSKIVHIPQEEKTATDKIYSALTNKGSHPAHHDYIMRELSVKWPVLYKALNDLLNARKETYNRTSSDIWKNKDL